MSACLIDLSCSLVCNFTIILVLVRPHQRELCVTVCVCLSGVVPCLRLLSGSVVDEGVAQYLFHYMFHSALRKEMEQPFLLHVVVR